MKPCHDEEHKMAESKCYVNQSEEQYAWSNLKYLSLEPADFFNILSYFFSLLDSTFTSKTNKQHDPVLLITSRKKQTLANALKWPPQTW